ncbi:MAG: hypothetical protein JWO94_3581 [Verrucomicrobiaceae bacterium]|nr:hypothetical protein [Verrucomicrobiaceae bacterium]
MHRFLWLIFILGLAPLHGEEVLYALDFTQQPAGDAAPWLKEHGFELRFDWKELHPRFEQGALRLSADHATAGLLSCDLGRANELRGAKRLRLIWGVTEFPEGADWERGINRLAIAVIVSFGRDKVPSGLPLGAHSEPYFICPFIGSQEVADKVYTGNLWKEGGRYVCLKSPHPEEMTTELEIDDLFKKLFGKDATPPVTAIGIQMNTKDTKGRASALIRRIEVLGDGR